MLINFKKKYIFFHIPKTGGTTVHKNLRHKSRHERRKEFWGWFSAHKTYSEVKPFLETRGAINFHKFCFVRNPYDKIYSGFLQGNGYGYEKSREGFNKFINELDNKIIYDKSRLHITPMHHFVYYEGKCMMDEIYRMENFEEDFNKILEKYEYEKQYFNRNVKNNKFDKLKYIDMYNKKSIEKINTLYDTDFEYFGYDKL